MGEEVIYEALYPYVNISSVSYIIYTDGRGDGGIDFNINDITIDNKTIYERHYSMRIINSTKANWYSLVHLNDSLPSGQHGGVYVGMLTKEELLKYEKYDNRFNLRYVEERYFRELSSCCIKL